MAYRYVVLSSAQLEIESIVSYLLKLAGTNSTAKSFMKELEEKMALVCDNPELFGLSRLGELAVLGYRSFLVNNYVVLYFFRQNTVYVAHVFHQRQDYARLV